MTSQQLDAIREVSAALQDAVDAAGPQGAPAGLLYAACLPTMSLDVFQAFMGAPCRCRQGRRSGHLYFSTKGVPNDQS